MKPVPSAYAPLLHPMVLAGMVVLGWLSYSAFPGHTYLYSDTQVYIPIFEHLRDPQILARDLLATGSHVSLSIYDETALWMRWLTGMGFREVLTTQQVLFRAAGFFGVYLIATAMGFGRTVAFLAAAANALGATISGPAVLVVEYEPVPRGFAIGLLLASFGFLAHRYFWLAGVAAALAFVYHAPTTAPFFGLLALWSFTTGREDAAARRFWIPLAAGAVALAILSIFQPHVAESQPFFTLLDPEWEKLQRMRASYNYLSQWPVYYVWHYTALAGLAMAAAWRVRDRMPGNIRWLFLGLPLAGAASMPLSYLLTEVVGWSLMPQIQPARAVLWCSALAVIAGVLAAAAAVENRRWWESALWLLLAYAIPAQPRVFELLWQGFSSRVLAGRVLAILLCAAISTLALYAAASGSRRGRAAPVLAAIVPFLLFPTLGRVKYYPNLNSPELEELVAWAQNATRPDEVFLFADAGQRLEPGIFRAEARRPVYVDWKSGGQVNFLRQYSFAWWARWQQVMAGGFRPDRLPVYQSAGITYLVLGGDHTLPGREPVYTNGRYRVYRINSF